MERIWQKSYPEGVPADIDAKTVGSIGDFIKASIEKFRDRTAAQVLSAFATDTALVLAHVDITEKSNEIPAAQTLLAELGVADGAIVTLDALHCQKNTSRTPHKATTP